MNFEGRDDKTFCFDLDLIASGNYYIQKASFCHEWEHCFKFTRILFFELGKLFIYFLRFTSFYPTFRSLYGSRGHRRSELMLHNCSGVGQR